jgi:phage terminase large subunit
MTDITFEYEIPPKLKPLYDSKDRYICVDGGRGSGKSWSVAYVLLDRGMEKCCRILCTREIQNTIRDSVHKLLSDIIHKHNLEKFYDIKNDAIVGKNGTEFIFKGLLRNINDIKSTEGIDYCWVEEAQSVSRASLEVLIPTVRNEGSQIIFTYNPTNDNDPVHADYKLTQRDNCLGITINYDENPFFPEVLKDEMEYDRAHDTDKYLHIWKGETVRHSEAQVFYGKWFGDMDFEAPLHTFFYYGADWGFNDPTVLIRCYIVGKDLYIDHEAYAHKLDIDNIPALFEKIPESNKYPITADNARPETINYVKRTYPLIQPSLKGKGSVEDGIAFIRSFEHIYIHSRCKHTQDEFRLYSFIVDRLTGAVSNKLEDKNNHCIDAVRYSLEKFYVSDAQELWNRFEMMR